MDIGVFCLFNLPEMDDSGIDVHKFLFQDVVIFLKHLAPERYLSKLSVLPYLSVHLLPQGYQLFNRPFSLYFITVHVQLCRRLQFPYFCLLLGLSHLLLLEKFCEPKYLFVKFVPFRPFLDQV